MAKTTKRKAASKSGVKKTVKDGVKNKAAKQTVKGTSGKGMTGGRPEHAQEIRVQHETDAVVLDRLWSVIMNRRDFDPTISHSARLLSRGTAKVAQKFGEEAVECVIEAVRGDRDSVIAESADVLYHLIVVWVSTGVAPAEVWAELMRREGVSGIAEKASRPQSGLIAHILKTTKIP